MPPPPPWGGGFNQRTQRPTQPTLAFSGFPKWGEINMAAKLAKIGL